MGRKVEKGFLKRTSGKRLSLPVFRRDSSRRTFWRLGVFSLPRHRKVGRVVGIGGGALIDSAGYFTRNRATSPTALEVIFEHTRIPVLSRNGCENREADLRAAGFDVSSRRIGRLALRTEICVRLAVGEEDEVRVVDIAELHDHAIVDFDVKVREWDAAAVGRHSIPDCHYPRSRQIDGFAA